MLEPDARWGHLAAQNEVDNYAHQQQFLLSRIQLRNIANSTNSCNYGANCGIYDPQALPEPESIRPESSSFDSYEPEEEGTQFDCDSPVNGPDSPLDLDSFVNMDHTICMEQSCEGLTADAVSTRKLYTRVHKVFLTWSRRDDPIYSVENDVDRSFVREFVQFYVENRKSGTHTHYVEALCYLQRRLDDVLSTLNRCSRKGQIREDKKWLKAYDTMLRQKTYQHNKTTFKDVQAFIDDNIPREKELQLIDSCYNFNIMPTQLAISRSNVATGFAHASQAGTRGSDVRGLKFNQAFIRAMSALGDKKCKVDHFVHDSGKGNSIGRVEYKAFATHINPRLDASAHFGLNLLLRFCVLLEPFPDFEKPDDYAKRPIYRSPNNYQDSLSAKTMHDNWKAFYDYNEVICTKITHQPRVNLQQRISDMGVSLPVLERFCGYQQEGEKKMNKSQKASYLMCPPVQAIAAAAGSDPHRPEIHNPGWEVDLPLGPNGCLKHLIPVMYVQMSKIQAAFDQCTSHKERASQQLIQSLGGLKALEWRIFHAVLLLASLPLDSENILVTDSPIILCRWSTFPVTQLPFFKSHDFKVIVVEVRQSQLKHARFLHLELSPGNKNLIQMEIGERILPCLQQQARVCMEMRECQHRTEKSIAEIKATLSKITCPGNSSTAEVEECVIQSTTAGLPNTRDESTQIPVLVCPPHNPKFCKDGLPRDRKPHVRINIRPFSIQNITASDYWQEYFEGSNGQVALYILETENKGWRSDKKFGAKTSIKSAWNLQAGLYQYMHYLLKNNYTKDTALPIIQAVFDQQASRTGRPDLRRCSKIFRKITDGIEEIGYIGDRREPVKSKKR